MKPSFDINERLEKSAEKQAQVAVNDKKLAERHEALETQISAVIDRMKMLTSETVLKRMEEEVVSLEKQIVELDNSDDKVEATVDIKVVLQYARYLVEHLPDTLHLSNPLRKAAFFGAIFNTMPNYQDLVGGTQKTAQIRGVNELFRIGSFENPNMVISPGIEPGLPG